MRAHPYASQTTTQYTGEFCSRDSYPRLGTCNTSIFGALHPNALRRHGILGDPQYRPNGASEKTTRLTPTRLRRSFSGLCSLVCMVFSDDVEAVSLDQAATITILKQSAGLLITLVKRLPRGQPPSSCSASTEFSSVLSDIWFPPIPATFSGPTCDW